MNFFSYRYTIAWLSINEEEGLLVNKNRKKELLLLLLLLLSGPTHNF